MSKNIKKLLHNNDNKYRAEWLDETNYSFMAQIKNQNDFEKDSFKTVDFNPKKNIKTIMGTLSRTGQDKIQTFIFPKDSYTRESVVSWLNNSDTISITPATSPATFATINKDLKPLMDEDLTKWELIFEGSQLLTGPYSTAEAVQKIATNYNPSFHAAPIFLDHQPGVALGWVDKLKAIGTKLYASCKDITQEAKDLLRDKKYKYKSAGLRTYAGMGPYLQELSLTNLPLIKGLGEVSSFSESTTTTYQYAEEMSMNEEQMKMILDKLTSMEAICAKLIPKEEDAAVTDASSNAVPAIPAEEKVDPEMEKLKSENAELKNKLKQNSYSEKINGWLLAGKIQPAIIENFGGIANLSSDLTANFSEEAFNTFEKLLGDVKLDLSEKVVTKAVVTPSDPTKSDVYNEITRYQKERNIKNFSEAANQYAALNSKEML